MLFSIVSSYYYTCVKPSLFNIVPSPAMFGRYQG
jgi:hypothetical protein